MNHPAFRHGFFLRWLTWLCWFWLACAVPSLQAATYANTATTFSWIDATGHTPVGYNTTPYKFNGGAGCGTTPPTLDDTISDIIPIGFNFVFGDKVFDSVRIQTNGRVQLVSSTIPLDNTTCGFGSPVTQLPIPDAGLNYTMRIYGSDLDPTLKSEVGGYSTNCTSRIGATPCFVSVGNVGGVPGFRKFAVTWSNVPEWAATSTASGSYNVQIVLLENGNFIYQYGTDVPGPQAANGQVAWQVSTTDYDAPLVGYPVPNTAILFFVPHPVVEYLMEQANWIGPGSVLDTSGNGSNGSPVGTAQTTSAGKICRGVVISATGTNAISTGISVPAIGSSGTIAFWYKANTAWSGAGTQDAQLLDATTTNGQWFFLVRRGGSGTSAGKLRFVVTDSSGAAQIVETPAIVVAAGTFKHIAVTWNFNNLASSNNDRLRIYVDGVQQAQTTFTSTTLTLSSSIGPLNIGGTRSGIAGQSGTTTSADGVLDEFRAYNYEANAATIVSIRDQNASGCLSHYSVSAPAAGLSCQASTVTIFPHTASHAAYTNNSIISLSTSDGKGDWVLQNGHGVLVPGPVNTGSATYLFTSESQVILSLTHPTTGAVTVGVTDGSYSAQENTPIVVTTCAAGKFIACEVSTPRCAPVVGSIAYANLYTKLANTAFALDLSALKIDGSVDTAFSGTITMNLLASSAAPTTFTASTNCPTAPTATIPLGTIALTSGRPPVAGKAVSTTAFSAVGPNYSAYPDVRVQFVCTSPTCSPAVTTCSPDAFTVRPKSFTITPSSNVIADSASGASSTNSPVLKTGVLFTLQADSATKGYFGTPVIDATKVKWSSVPVSGRPAPGVGMVAGSFTTPASIGSGNGAIGNFTYDEVGYFQFDLGGVYNSAYAAISGDVGNGDCTNDFSNTLVGGKYGCKVANQAVTSYFGRFIPDHFDTVVTQGCSAGSFTYSAQPFTTVVTARNSTGGITINYAGIDFAKSTTLSNAGVAINMTGNTLVATDFASGVGTASAVKYTFPTSATVPATVTLRALDTDAVSSSGSTEGSVNIRGGRVRLQNAYGSELLDLPMTMRAEYWDATTGWQLNSADTCTDATLAFAAVTSPDITASTCIWELAPLFNSSGAKGCITAPVGRNYKETGVTGFAGDFNLWLKKPGVGNAGALTVTATVPSWLQFNWTGAGNVNPTARATFGVFKSPLIYRRENY
jgi:MSHA biogenesis protein MshQ